MIPRHSPRRAGRSLETCCGILAPHLHATGCALLLCSCGANRSAVTARDAGILCSGKIMNLEVPGFGRAKGHSLLLRPRLQLREVRPRDYLCTLSSSRGGVPSGPGERCRHSALRTGRLLSRGPCTPVSHCTAGGGESLTRAHSDGRKMEV